MPPVQSIINKYPQKQYVWAFFLYKNDTSPPPTNIWIKLVYKNITIEKRITTKLASEILYIYHLQHAKRIPIRQTKKTPPIYQEKIKPVQNCEHLHTPWCEDVKPQSDADFQASAVHSYEKIYTPGMEMKTQIQKLFRTVHSCGRFPIFRAKYENEKTNQRSSGLLKYSHPWCEGVRPQCNADLQTSAVHSCEKIDIPGVKTTNPKT